MQQNDNKNQSKNELKEDLMYWHCLAQIEQVGPSRCQKLLNYFNSIQEIFTSSHADLLKSGLKPSIADIIYQKKQKIDLQNEWKKLQALNINIISRKSRKYPQLLSETYPPPFALYYQGNIDLLNKTCLAVVGTRKITGYGRRVAPKIVKPLVDNGITIVSGLALGVDALAHQVCLENDGQTIAVLGSGIDQIYPAKNRWLAGEIIKKGLVVSEYPPGSQPLKQHFPFRNRIISGLSLGTIVIEGAQDSGSLITAKYALDQNREIFAVPGNIFASTSEGTNELIKLGAKPVTSAKDIIESLNIKQIQKFQQAKEIIPDNSKEKIILQILANESLHVNEIIKLTNLDAQAINSTLSIMEIKGKVKNLGGNNYVINS